MTGSLTSEGHESAVDPGSGSPFAGRVLSAEVDVTDSCGSGCTRAFFYESGSIIAAEMNVLIGSPGT